VDIGDAGIGNRGNEAHGDADVVYAKIMRGSLRTTR
jgi:hypothetical protein